jgi:PAS domain S-box-containing protein
MLGSVPAERLGRTMIELIHPDDRDAIAGMVLKGTRRAGTATSVVFRFQTVTGDWRVLEATSTSCLSEPAIKGFMEDAHDVTEQTTSSRAIRTLSQGNQAMVHAIDGDSLLADTCRINAALSRYRPTWVALHCSRRQVPVVPSTATESTVASSTAFATSPTSRSTMPRGPRPPRGSCD